MATQKPHREEEIKLDWRELAKHFSEHSEIRTRLGKKFFVKQVTDYGIFLVIPEEVVFISRKDLEKAFKLIQTGTKISSPRDYAKYVSKEHPNYAYSLLRSFLFPFTDRRRYPRVNREVDVELSLGDKKIRTKTVDISAGGVRLKLNIELRKDTTYPLIIFLEGEEPISTLSRVVWTAPADDQGNFFIGMEYAYIDEYDRLKISSAVNKWLLEEEDIFRVI